MSRFVAALSLAIVLSPVLSGQDSDFIAVSHSNQASSPSSDSASPCLRDLRSDKKAGLVVSDVDFSGVTVGSKELSSIKNQIIGACLDEGSDDIAELAHAAFSEQGFEQAQVENVTLKSSDSLAVPKPITLKADVTEGPRFRFGSITFTGNQAVSDARLRAAFPVKRGELYRRSRIVSGFSEIRKLYVPKGYIDLSFVPDLAFSSTGTADLTIALHEGPQYRMGELKIYAKKEISGLLASQWQLREGAVFDGNYPQTFLDQSHSLPPDFDRQNIVLVRNCPDASVAVLLIVDQTDPGLQSPPKQVRCEKRENNE